VNTRPRTASAKNDAEAIKPHVGGQHGNQRMRQVQGGRSLRRTSLPIP
jgi:hypothetical protein